MEPDDLLCSRRVIGWAMSAKPDQHLAIEALQMALASRRPHQGLIHHTDQGTTYTSVAYQHRLTEYGIAASMSRKGNCYDKAVAESFFSTLKNDLVHERDYKTREETRAEIFEFIEVFYNRQRLHQTLGYVSPEQFESQNPVPLRGCLRNRG
jgi:putative transposase